MEAFDILIKTGGTGIKDFLAALVKPIQTSSDNMQDFEAEYSKRARFNGQKVVLEAALNDIFGVTSAPFIYIETNQDIGSSLYFFEPAEGSPVYFSEPSEVDPVYFFEPGDSTSDYDFTVFIPTGIHTAELERRVRAEVNLYKVAAATFDIQTF